MGDRDAASGTSTRSFVPTTHRWPFPLVLGFIAKPGEDVNTNYYTSCDSDSGEVAEEVAGGSGGQRQGPVRRGGVWRGFDGWAEGLAW